MTELADYIYATFETVEEVNLAMEDGGEFPSSQGWEPKREHFIEGSIYVLFKYEEPDMDGEDGNHEGMIM